MMDTEVDRELLEKIADLVGKPVGAFNIRKDTGCDGRQSTEHIEITGKTDKAGIDIRVKPGTEGETCHIPVIITKPGVQEMVYNDFYIGENSNVNIVAGCGIHNCGDQTSRHDGVHTFYVGKNSHGGRIPGLPPGHLIPRKNGQYTAPSSGPESASHWFFPLFAS